MIGVDPCRSFVTVGVSWSSGTSSDQVEHVCCALVCCTGVFDVAFLWARDPDGCSSLHLKCVDTCHVEIGHDRVMMRQTYE
jgi:hypothetical protein